MPVNFVTDENFEEAVLGSDKPTLVDFWAEWCGPCKALAPTLEDIAREFGERINVYKLDVEENPKTSTTYSIHGIPTLLLFHSGQAVGMKVGLQSRSELVSWIESAMTKD